MTDKGVRPQLIESTWLTDKPTESTVSSQRELLCVVQPWPVLTPYQGGVLSPLCSYYASHFYLLTHTFCFRWQRTEIGCVQGLKDDHFLSFVYTLSDRAFEENFAKISNKVLCCAGFIIFGQNRVRGFFYPFLPIRTETINSSRICSMYFCFILPAAECTGPDRY